MNRTPSVDEYLEGERVSHRLLFEKHTKIAFVISRVCVLLHINTHLNAFIHSPEYTIIIIMGQQPDQHTVWPGQSVQFNYTFPKGCCFSIRSPYNFILVVLMHVNRPQLVTER